VRVVQVIGGADGHIIHTVFDRATPQFLQVAVKSLNLRKEARIKGKLVKQPDRIVRVHSSDQTVPRITDGFEVPGGNVTCSTDQCKVFYVIFHCQPDFIPIKMILT